MSPRRTSDIWNHYNELPGKQKAKCCYCSRDISFVSGSIGNLRRHLKTKHPTINFVRREFVSGPANTLIEEQRCDDVSTRCENNVVVMPTTSQSAVALPPTSQPATTICSARQNQTRIGEFMTISKPLALKKSMQFDEQLTKMVVKGYHPFSIVEEEEFIKFVQMLSPGYQLPTRKTVSQSLIPKIYFSVREKVQQKLKNANAVCLTTDSWTSLNNESFVAVTAHFIDGETNLSSHLLDCISFNERHTAANLSSFLITLVNEWEINDKIVVVVTDNAPNIVAAIKLSNWRHLSCFAHTVNLIVQSSLQEIDATIAKVKSIVEYFKRSSSALSKLKSTQEQMELPPLKLIQDVITRWNSTYEMISRLMKIKDAVIATLAIIQPELNVITTTDWDILQRATDILQIFNEVTGEVSAEKSVSTSKIIIFYKSMYNHVQECSADRQPVPKEITSMCTKLMDNLNKRLNDCESNELYCQTTLLDPRFKKYGFIQDKKYEEAYALLRKKVCAIRGPVEIESDAESSAARATTTSQSSLWRSFDTTVKNLSPKNPTAAGIVEADKYIQEPLLNRVENPLDWWQERRYVYPRLYILVQRRLCIVPTSVPCERIFSKAGQILTEKRNRLSSSKTSQLVFLYSNMK